MDKLDMSIIIDNLKADILGRNIEYFEKIDSTNTYAKTNICDIEHGTIIVSETQSSGRGRQGNHWDSQKGKGLWMSIVVKPKINITDSIKITSVVALGVRKGIKNIINESVHIKWPNDIIINKKKVCGILVESVISGENIGGIVIGIGINVSHSKDYFEKIDYASSINIESISTVSREEVFISVVNAVEMELDTFFITKKLDIKELKNHSVFYGKNVKVIKKDSEILGKVIDFLEDGQIVIEDYQNDRIIINSSDVSIRGLNSYID